MVALAPSPTAVAPEPPPVSALLPQVKLKVGGPVSSQMNGAARRTDISAVSAREEAAPSKASRRFRIERIIHPSAHGLFPFSRIR